MGCGDKPWRGLFPDARTYIGVDYLGPSATCNASGAVDVCADAIRLPFASSTSIVLSVLRHWSICHNLTWPSERSAECFVPVAPFS